MPARESQTKPPEQAAAKAPETRVPGGLRWAAMRVGWAFESAWWRFADFFRFRGPVFKTALVAVVALVLGGGAFAYQTSKDDSDDAPTVARQTPPATAPATPAPPPSTGVSGPVGEATGTLKGVVPNFEASSGEKSSSDDEAGDGAGRKGGGNSPAEVKPAPPPKSPPLRVAHRFAVAFVSYEIGKKPKKVKREFGKTATDSLSKSLRKNPPRLPANGKVPKATVLNVVKGPSKNKRMNVSVALRRLGATSELRLDLKRTRGHWLVQGILG